MSVLKGIVSAIAAGTVLLSPLCTYADGIKAYIVSGSRGAMPSDANKNFLEEQDPILYAIIKGSDGKFYGSTSRAKIGGKVVDVEELPEGADVKWYKVEPTGHNYTNSNSTPGWWDKIEYSETEFPCDTACSADVHSTVSTDYYPNSKAGLGTMRYKIKVIFQGQSASTPGKESRNRKGIKENVHRISVRPDNTYVGWLESFFNLPFTWGSAGDRNQGPASSHQTELRIGADCADFAVAGVRAFGGKDIPYWASSGFDLGGIYTQKFADIIFEDVKKDGKRYTSGGKPIRIGKGRGMARVGDIIKAPAHVMVLSKDNPPAGVLDESDLYIHTLFDNVSEQPLGNLEGFNIVRWKIVPKLEDCHYASCFVKKSGLGGRPLDELDPSELRLLGNSFRSDRFGNSDEAAEAIAALVMKQYHGTRASERAKHDLEEMKRD